MSPTVPVVIALDCSTTACKAVVFGLDGRTVCESRRYLTLATPHPGWFEQDPLEWWEGAADALSAAVTLLPPDHRPIALGLAHQRETFACLNDHGRPVRPAIVWLDTRSAAQVRRLGTPEVHRITGKPASTVPGLYKLAWLADHEPATVASTRLVVDVHAYLTRELIGRAVSSTASADSLALLDLVDRTWSEDLIRGAGWEPKQFPELAAPGTIMGGLTPDVARRTGLPRGLPVVAGAGDGQCAGLGVGAAREGTGYLNLGTSFSLGTYLPRPLILPGLRTMLSPFPDRWAVETLLSSGGLTLSWMRRLLGRHDERELDELASAVAPGAAGLICTPYLTGRETPVYDPSQRAAFIGLGPEHGPAELYRAGVEGLARDQREALDYLEEQVGRRLDPLVVTGGLGQSPLVTRVMTDTLDRSLVIAAERESTALGAAMMALAAVDPTGRDLATITAAMVRGGSTLQPEPSAVAVYRSVREQNRRGG